MTSARNWAVQSYPSKFGCALTARHRSYPSERIIGCVISLAAAMSFTVTAHILWEQVLSFAEPSCYYSIRLPTLRHVEPIKTTAHSASTVSLFIPLTKNKERSLRRWPQLKAIDPDRDYFSGKPLDGEWGGRHSIEPTREKPITDGPQHRVMQFDMGRRSAADRN